MKMDVKAIEITSTFEFMGSIKKIETFTSKGGGLSIKMETGEVDKAIDLINAQGNALVVTIGVSKTKVDSSGNDDEQDELDFEDIDPSNDSDKGTE